MTYQSVSGRMSEIEICTHKGIVASLKCHIFNSFHLPRYAMNSVVKGEYLEIMSHTFKKLLGLFVNDFGLMVVKTY